jgi:hypothetical protein
MNITIQSLREMSSPGVFLLLERRKKRVYVGFGVNMLNSVTRLIGDLNVNKSLSEMAEDAPFLEISIAEKIETTDQGKLRVRMRYWSQEYKKLGYTLYRKYEGMRYKVKTVLDISGRVVVMLTRPGCKPIVVGVFVRPHDAKLFVRLNYAGKEILEPIYCGNKYTKDWLLKHGI